MKPCGDCSLCCKLLDVPTLDKPAGVWCKHACNGCAIHATRPNICKSFNCLWKQSPVMGEDLRPDKSGIIFELYEEEKTVIAITEPDIVWNEGATRQLINQILLDAYIVWVVIGEERNLLLPEGQTEEDAIARAKKAWERKMT